MFPSNILEFRCLSSFSLGISLISCNGSLCHIQFVFVSLLFANRWYAFEGVFYIPLIALSLHGVFRGCFAVGFSPFLYQVSPDWRLFRRPFCFKRPRAKSLVLIFARPTKSLILFSGAVGEGKSLALQARTPRPTWFPKESLMPLLKMLFSEIPVDL